MARSLTSLYRGAMLPEKTARSLGENASLFSISDSIARRRKLLSTGLDNGKLSEDRLSDFDRRLVSSGLNIGAQGPSMGDEDDGGKSPGGFLGNLGSDMWEAFRGIPMGVKQTSSAIWKDISSWDFQGGEDGKSAIMEDVAKPTVTQMGKDISNIAHGRWDELYANPLNPLLTVATVGSLGVGGAARAGLKPARAVTSRENRPDLMVGDNVPIRRDYSSRPIANVAQRAFDRVAPQRTQEYFARTAEQRREFADAEAGGAIEAARAAHPVVQVLKELTPFEMRALVLSWDQVNTPQDLAVLRQSWERTINNQHDETTGVGVNLDQIARPGTKAYTTQAKQLRARIDSLDQGVAELLFDPTDNMKKADQVWKKDREQGGSRIDLPDEVHNAALDAQRKRLDEMITESGQVRSEPREGGIEPEYMPHKSTLGQEWFEPSALGRAFGQEPRLVPGKTARRETNVTPQNMLAPGTASYMRESTGVSFMSGTYRDDARTLAEHVKRRERDVVQTAYKRDTAEKWSYKGEDEHGEYKTMKFKDPQDMARQIEAKGGNPKDWVFASPDFPIAWFRQEPNMLKDVLARGHSLVEKGILPESPSFMQIIETDIDRYAQLFTKSLWGAMKRPGIAIPKSFYEYQKKLLKARDPMTGLLSPYQWIINKWRQSTLSWMPRWIMNTAVGSFVQALVSGTWNPKDYYVAMQMKKKGLMPPGVYLGRSATHEMIDDPSGWLERSTGIPGGVTQAITEKVQAIEDFFRGGVFIHKLRREGKEKEIEILDEMADPIEGYHRKGMTDEEQLGDYFRAGPEEIRHALHETNKFMYNYQHLGPTDRRYVRQFIPFWGWYKFITKLTWRLPVEYPGRALILTNLGAIGNEEMEEMGAMPEWLSGAIMLNYNGSAMTYLSGMGLNPFSGFANPPALFAKQGGADALMEMGQFSPVIQAGLSAWGIDPMTSDSVRVSPQSGVEQDWHGNLTDLETGEKRKAGSVNPIQRLLMSFARTFPQARIIEREVLMGGATPFPESVPIIDPKQMYLPEDRPVEGDAAILLDALGLRPKSYDLEGYQDQLPKRREYAEGRAETDLKRIRKNLGLD